MLKRSQRVLCSVALAAGLAAGSTGPITGPAAAQTAQPVPSGAPSSFADIVQRVAPAVVSVDVTRSAPARSNIPQLFPGFPFFFGFPNAPDGSNTPSLPNARVSGSGFFITSTGYIVTNNHVVENATKVAVRTNDGREFDARIIGRDPLTDLAVLKVEGSSFPHVTFETKAKPRVGDWVIAMGNPFGLGGTATSGIVSAYGRDIGEAYVDYLQIDAPINRGNSGGPTFDVYGRVIGVNTAIFSPSGGSVGIGFAIPADIAETITKQLMSGGSIVRGHIGATVQNLTPEIADSLGIPGRKGALVAELTPGGPAERAGLRAGDAILSLNGRELTSSTDLTRRVGASREGDQLRLEVWRDGRRQTIEVRAGRRPVDQGPGAVSPTEAATLGLRLRPLDQAARAQHRLPATVRGVVIEAVAPGSDAAEKGLRAGDVLERVGDRDVLSAEDVREAIDAARRQGRPSVLVRLWREGRSLFVPLRLTS
jgi:serine protease Do